VVAHACHPSYLGGKDQEDCGLRSAWVKSWGDTHLNKQVLHTCNLSYIGGIGWKIVVQASPGKK
jgi:hypothetical protein